MLTQFPRSSGSVRASFDCSGSTLVGLIIDETRQYSATFLRHELEHSSVVADAVDVVEKRTWFVEGLGHLIAILEDSDKGHVDRGGD